MEVIKSVIRLQTFDFLIPHRFHIRCGVICKLEMFSHLSDRSFGLSFVIRLKLFYWA